MAIAGNGMMVSIAESFELGGQSLFENEINLRKKLGEDSGSANPSLLAQYQAVISEVTILRNAQSSTVKAFKDIDATIVANFR